MSTTTTRNYYDILLKEDNTSKTQSNATDNANANATDNANANATDNASSVQQEGVCADFRYPKSDTICDLSRNLLLGDYTTLIDYISKQIDEENATTNKELEGWTIVGERLDFRMREYELLSLWLLIRDKNVNDYYLDYLDLPLQRYAKSDIFNVFQYMGFHLDIDNRNFNFESDSTLVAKKSNEIKTLKEVWVDLALSNNPMCDMIKYLIIPILIQQRVTELHFLKRLYTDYRQLTQECINFRANYMSDDYYN